jgi:hypothetical protein
LPRHLFKPHPRPRPPLGLPALRAPLPEGLPALAPTGGGLGPPQEGPGPLPVGLLEGLLEGLAGAFLAGPGATLAALGLLGLLGLLGWARGAYLR